MDKIIDNSQFEDTVPTTSAAGSSSGGELFRESPALRALSLFVQRYSWDETLISGRQAVEETAI